MMNDVLEKLEISTIKKKALADNKVIEKKIREIGDAIGRKLKIDQTLPVGDIVMNQIKQEFDTMDKQNQYRVLTAMPKESSIHLKKNTFGVTEHKAKRAKQIQNEKP